MNKLIPGSIKRINESAMAFKQMENIQAFQEAVKALGVPEEEIFQTVDLFERKNLPQVTLCIHAIARLVLSAI